MPCRCLRAIVSCAGTLVMTPSSSQVPFVGMPPEVPEVSRDVVVAYLGNGTITPPSSLRRCGGTAGQRPRAICRRTALKASRRREYRAALRLRRAAASCHRSSRTTGVRTR